MYSIKVYIYGKSHSLLSPTRNSLRAGLFRDLSNAVKCKCRYTKLIGKSFKIMQVGITLVYCFFFSIYIAQSALTEMMTNLLSKA